MERRRLIAYHLLVKLKGQKEGNRIISFYMNKALELKVPWETVYGLALSGRIKLPLGYMDSIITYCLQYVDNGNIPPELDSRDIEKVEISLKRLTRNSLNRCLGITPPISEEI